MLEAIAQFFTGKNANKNKKVKGTVILMRKNAFAVDFNDLGAGVIDRVSDLIGRQVSIQLVSAVNGDKEKGMQGKLGTAAPLEDWNARLPSITADESAFSVTFDWEESFGYPGAFFIRNTHPNEFYLKTLTLEDVPGHGRIHFLCNSWVYPADKYKSDRIFFANQTYLPSETPEPLRFYRAKELQNLRGDGTGERKEWDRVYDYDFYNDLGDPDDDSTDARPVLGGSKEYPYPRRVRTGRKPTAADPKSESRVPGVSTSDLYVPRDERFGHLKKAGSLAYQLKAVAHLVIPEIKGIDTTPNEFDSFEEVNDLYEGGIKLPRSRVFQAINEKIPFETIKQFLQRDSEGLLKFTMPQVIKESKTAWTTDEEFARETLSGVNPVVIRRLEEFPPTSKLDPTIYGNQNSSITASHIENQLDGLKISEAVNGNRLFMLDFHDALMPYLRRINATTSKTYATRTLFFLKSEGTLKPLAIELSLPHPGGDKLGAVSKVYTPAAKGVEGSMWQLAKAYVTVNDSGVHQLISHWLHTHAVIEPFVIATNRQLSVIHPIYKLLHPHYRDTMNINAAARQILINAGGIIESTFFPGEYSMEMSAVIYKDWAFPEQALPADLIKRGMAIEDSNSPTGLRLVIEDYPYAVDGLDIWSAIKTWVEDYCNFYYKTDEMVQKDSELQSWWKEIREVGHGDKKDAAWWPKMRTRQELIDSCTIIIWTASALHAAVNFGQYPYAGYLPNRPTSSRRFMPEPGTPEYDELKSSPDKVFLKTITAQLESLVVISVLEILSTHSSDEIYLGQRDDPEWTKDAKPLEALERLGKKLKEIEQRIVQKNNTEKLKNRRGPAKVPYTLLYPSSEEGLTGKGIPNSISI